jgi:hypothetical protein
MTNFNSICDSKVEAGGPISGIVKLFAGPGKADNRGSGSETRSIWSRSGWLGVCEAFRRAYGNFCSLLSYTRLLNCCALRLACKSIGIVYLLMKSLEFPTDRNFLRGSELSARLCLGLNVFEHIVFLGDRLHAIEGLYSAARASCRRVHTGQTQIALLAFPTICEFDW